MLNRTRGHRLNVLLECGAGPQSQWPLKHQLVNHAGPPFKQVAGCKIKLSARLTGRFFLHDAALAPARDPGNTSPSINSGPTCSCCYATADSRANSGDAAMQLRHDTYQNSLEVYPGGGSECQPPCHPSLGLPRWRTSWP